MKQRIVEISNNKLSQNIDVDGGLSLRGHLVVPYVLNLKLNICDKAHKFKYRVHPTVTKTTTFCMDFQWKGMKQNVGIYVSECVVCKQVIEHQVPIWELQFLPIPK